MNDKRHLVLYGVSIVLLLVLVGFVVFGGTDKVSDTTEQAPVATTTTGTTLATSTRVTEAPKVPATKPFQFEIAASEAARIKGLSGRTEVKADYGMLFVFPKKERQGFWMKDMRVPIDIIWISDERVVVGVDANVSPQTYPNVFYSPEPVRYVLETKAGEAARLGLTTGTKVVLPLP